MKCKHPQIVKCKVFAFGTEVQVHYTVPCWYCDECLKIRRSIFRKFDKKHFAKKEVNDET